MSTGHVRPEAERLLSQPRLARLLAALDGDGEETRVVGGAVRNALLNHPVHEVDLATTAIPQETKRRAEAAGFKVVPTGLAHGTLTVIVGGEPFEVTSLREDVETDGRRAVVRFGRDFESDARRRDFTINALSLRASGEICDYTGGLADLARKRVRFIGEARQRIREDYLRILRFFRFSAEYAHGPLDAEGLSAAIRERRGLARLSRERVRAELLKLIVARRAPEVVEILSQAGFVEWLLAGIGDPGRLRRVAEAGASAESGAGPDPVLRLAAFAVQVREDAERLRERLRLSNSEEERCVAYADMLARLKSRGEPLAVPDVRRLVAERGVQPLVDALLVTRGEPRPVASPAARAQLARFAAGEEVVPLLPIRGADLVYAGIARGPALGEALARARADWLDHGCPEGPGERERLLALAVAAARMR